jgi:glycosyltransferase involved in cell wall biosynthesis
VRRPSAPQLSDSITMSYRVLMIAPTSFFLDYGCHVRILEEARVLQSLGHRVKIVTYPLGRNLPGLDIERTIPIPFRSRNEVGPSRSKILIDALLALKAFQAALAFKPHIIHAHLHEGALIGGILSRGLRVPLVFDFQGSMTSEIVDHRFLDPRSKILPLIRGLEWQIDRLPQKILTSSQNAARLLTDEFHVQASKILILSDNADASAFGPVEDGERAAQMRELQARLGIPDGHKIVVYIGLLDTYRGTDVLLDAAAQLLARRADTHFVIIGFPNIERYQTRARELGIDQHVSFPGRVPYEDVPRWLSLGDVAVEPKMSATEAAGKVLNYMAMALPVVAFDIPVMHEYLGDLGVFAPLGDAAAFADQIETLLEHPERARAIGLALRERAQQHFSWERAGRAIECVYQELLKKEP